MPVTLKDEAIPQATIEAVRAVVDACASGAKNRQAAAQATGISPRHIAYAVSAAVALGLIRAARDTLELTLLGQSLATSETGSEDERRILVQGVIGSDLLRKLVPGLADETPPDVGEISANIRRLGGLAEATAVHRARMILAWRKRLVSASAGRQRRRSGKSTRAGQERPSAKPDQSQARAEKPAAPRRPVAKGVWRRLELHGYRSMERADIVLAPFKLLAGVSGSGKSNLVDALLFVRDVAFDAEAALEARGGFARIRRWGSPATQPIGIDLRAARAEAELETDYVRHQMKIRPTSAGGHKLASERTEIIKRGAVEALLERHGDRLSFGDAALPAIHESESALAVARRLKPFAKIAPLFAVRRYRFEIDAMRCPQLPGSASRLDEDGRNLAAALAALGGADHDELVRVMAEIIPGLEAIEVLPRGHTLALTFKLRHGDQAIELEASELADGALRALAMLTACLGMRADELIVIEEPALGLGSGPSQRLLQVLRAASRRGAILLVTHDAALVAAAAGDEVLDMNG